MKPPAREAIAIEYGRREVPVLSARGHDDVAERILAEARRHGVHIAENPTLLTLLSRVETEQNIPPELYNAVAVVLAWVYWLKGMRPGDEKR